jgi:hypothetical protein
MAIWYIFPVLVFWNKKNLAALFFTAGRWRILRLSKS